MVRRTSSSGGVMKAAGGGRYRLHSTKQPGASHCSRKEVEISVAEGIKLNKITNKEPGIVRSASTFVDITKTILYLSIAFERIIMRRWLQSVLWSS